MKPNRIQVQSPRESASVSDRAKNQLGSHLVQEGVAKSPGLFSRIYQTIAAFFNRLFGQSSEKQGVSLQKRNVRLAGDDVTQLMSVASNGDLSSSHINLSVKNQQDQKGQTALMYAILGSSQFKHQNVAILIEHQANLDLQNQDGDTALMLAIRQHDDDIVEALVRARANQTLKNKFGQNALELAHDLNAHSKIIDLLSGTTH